MIETSRETVGSALAFYERFCQRAEKHMASCARASEKAYAVSRRQEAERTRLIEQAAEKKKQNDRAVQHVLSAPDWTGIASFTYDGYTSGGRVRMATLTLNEELDITGKRHSLFPQLSVDMGAGVRPIVITLFERRGWHTRKVEQEGRVVRVEIAMNTSHE